MLKYWFEKEKQEVQISNATQQCAELLLPSVRFKGPASDLLNKRGDLLTVNPILAQKSSVLVSPLKKGARAERDSVMERTRKDEREQREGCLTQSPYPVSHPIVDRDFSDKYSRVASVAMAVGSCRTGPPADWNVLKTFDRICPTIGWELV